MRRRAVLVIALILPTPIAAQTPATHVPPDGVMLTFVRFADIFGSRLVDAFDSIPAARYDYRPTPVQQTIGYIAQHLEDANYGLCNRLGNRRHRRTQGDEHFSVRIRGVFNAPERDLVNDGADDRIAS